MALVETPKRSTSVSVNYLILINQTQVRTKRKAHLRVLYRQASNRVPRVGKQPKHLIS